MTDDKKELKLVEGGGERRVDERRTILSITLLVRSAGFSSAPQVAA